MTLRELIDDAINQISTYKSPDIGEAKERLSEITEAAGLGSLKHDYIEEIREYNSKITIETSWSARGCAQTSTYEFPSSIIDTEDPIKAAKVWGLNTKISKHQSELASLESRADWYRNEIAKLQSELQTTTI